MNQEDQDHQHGGLLELQQELSLLNEKSIVYENSFKDQQKQIHDLIDKNHATSTLLTSTTKDCNQKLDMATSRILELETILSLVRLETEERMKSNSNYSLQIAQEQFRIKDMVLSLSSKFEDYRLSIMNTRPPVTSKQSNDVTMLLQDQLIEGFQQLTSCWNTLEGSLYEILTYQSQPTVLSHETTDLFTTINALNNTIKTIKTKAGNRLQKANDQYQDLEKQLQRLQNGFDAYKLQYEVLKVEHEQLQKASRQNERDTLMTKTELVRIRRQHEEQSKIMGGKDQVIDQLYGRCESLQRECDQLCKHLDELKSQLQCCEEEKSRSEERLQSLTEEMEKKSKNDRNIIQELEETLSGLKLDLSNSQQDAKRKLNKRKKELASIYEEHKIMRIDFIKKEEQLMMSLEDSLIKNQVIHSKYHTSQMELSKSMMKLNEIEYKYRQLERQYEELRVNQEIQLMKHRKAQEDLVDKLNREKDALKDALGKMNVLQHSIDQKTKKWKAMTHQVHEHERLVQELRLSVREKTDTIVELQDMTVKIQLKEEERFKSMFREAISNLQQELELKWTELEVQLETNTKHLVELISALDHVKKNHSIIIAQCNEKLSYMKMKHEQNVGELQKKIENLLHQGKLYDEMKQQVEEQYEQSQRRMISDYRQLQEQHQTLTNQLELVHEEMLQLQQSSKDFTTENALLKETLSQKKLEINRQIEKIHQLQGVINQKQEQINQYYQRLKVSDDLTRQLSQEKDAIQEERNDLQEKLLEKQFAFDALSTANQQLVEEKEAIVKRIGDDIRGQIKELERDIDKLSEEKGKVKQENQSLHQQVSQYEAERSKLREDLEKHLIQIRSLQDEHRQQEESHAKILIALNHEKGSLLQQLNETTANYIQAKQESAKLQKDFSNKMIEAQHLQDRLNIYKTEYRKQEREMAKMVGLFQQEFSSLQHQIADIAMFEVVRDDLPMEKPQNAGIQSVLSEPQKIILDDESPLKTSQRVSIIMEQQNETSTKNMTEPYHSTVENVATVPVLQNTIAAEANMLSPSRNKKKEQEKALEKEEVRELNYFDPLHPAPSTPLKNIIPSPSKQNSQPVDSHHVSRCIAEEDVVDIKSERPKSRSSIKQTSSDRSKTATKRVAKVNKVDAPPSPQSPKKRN